MPEKKRPEKIKMATELEKVATEILAVRERRLEPFIKVFQYSGENIAASGLGKLVGVFEVAERSEDSAYIVNFLASVAKKEYFSNPRRGAIESFEASLHKVNLALAELVKHGNIIWLGKLHGVLGILEKNNIHFSATGKAEILLLRNGQLSEISAGLASEESSVHPIKTFVEVSSGRLIENDKIILTSPELFTLLSPEDLKKNALRMDNEHFTQFLRTALTNELDLAGTIIIDVALAKPVPPPKKKDENIKEVLHNVFSQQTFAPNVRITQNHKAEPEHIPPQTPPSEYTDSKTGHIYVQGGAPEKSPSRPSLDRAMLVLQNIGQNINALLGTNGKLLRKGKKQSSLFFDLCKERSLRAIRKTGHLVATQLTKGSRRLYTAVRSVPLPKIPAKIPTAEQEANPLIMKPETDLSPSVPIDKKTREALPDPTDSRTNDDIPIFLKERISTFYQKNSPPEISITPPNPPLRTAFPFRGPKDGSKNASLPFLYALQSSTNKGWQFLVSLLKTATAALHGMFRRTSLPWQHLDRRQKKTILIGGIILLVLGIGIFSLTRPKEEVSTTPSDDTPEEQLTTPSFPLDKEKNALLLDEPITLPVQDNIVTSVFLRDEAYLITNNGILSVRDQARSVLPANSGTSLFATAMNDIGFIFLYTDTQELLAWNPVNRAFVKNTLTLPAGTVVKGMGTYLTYLYILDGATNQIYRYPRAENGFGEPTVWLKDSLTFGDQPLVTISENIFLATTRETIQTFLRGRFVKNLESPTTPLAVTDIFTQRNLTNVYALDSQNKRILVWNQDGALLRQYFSEHLADAQSIIVNEKTSEAFITTERSLLSFPLKP